MLSARKGKTTFPHYPVNIACLYLKLLALYFCFFKLKEVAHNCIFTNDPCIKKKNSRLSKIISCFFSPLIFEKELKRIQYVQHLLDIANRIPVSNLRGFVGRSDGNNSDFENEITQ
jgi:hypothetical protein